jgi:Ni/Co efflux regulator RcnB
MEGHMARHHDNADHQSATPTPLDELLDRARAQSMAAHPSNFRRGDRLPQNLRRRVGEETAARIAASIPTPRGGES